MTLDCWLQTELLAFVFKFLSPGCIAGDEVLLLNEGDLKQSVDRFCDSGLARKCLCNWCKKLMAHCNCSLPQNCINDYNVL